MFSRLILVVDDSPSLRVALTTALTHAGYRVVEAENGRVALDVARRLLPDAVLLDLCMPVLTGWQAAQALRLDPRTAEIPLIAASAMDPVDPVEVERAGFHSFLPKPFTLTRLCAAVADALGEEAEPPGVLERAA